MKQIYAIVVMVMGLGACSGSGRGDAWVYYERDDRELVVLSIDLDGDAEVERLSERDREARRPGRIEAFTLKNKDFDKLNQLTDARHLDIYEDESDRRSPFYYVRIDQGRGDVTLELDRDQKIDGETEKLLDLLNDLVKDRAD